MFKTVLFPIDQTRESRHAAELVVNLVKTYNSTLTVLSVVVDDTEGSESASPDPEMKSPEAIAKLLQTAQTLFQDQGINAQTMSQVGKPAFVICDVADEIGADLIIMGSRGMDITSEGIADSVSNRVINLAPCPVLIVP
ncbi:MAG: universal stress protein [Merismopedia sp. SIO2A8]|nr:universal stress protein [Symploca sp. SIO2B6]NET48135.1 universal stress protein [Merismopedia sp. SIO2A8]